MFMLHYFSCYLLLLFCYGSDLKLYNGNLGGGPATILELVIGFVSVIMNINIAPTLWGISLELGSEAAFFWAMAMNFPGSFYFVSMFLFSEEGVQEKFYPKCTFGAPKLGQMQEMEHLLQQQERASDFICQRKLKTGKYLINCIKMPIHLRTDEDRVEMLMDLSSRLVQWRHQEPDIIEFDKDLEDVIDVPSEKLSPL
ncbi:hypothetical protein WN944_001149 [Citrus x changshan-huyou]|uniref:Uncharacterized protein n=1 Tax=Citrus x changshan-huyou TaxID=2935761 RepID=A0AAP0MGN4_9ROSI